MNFDGDDQTSSNPRFVMSKVVNCDEMLIVIFSSPTRIHHLLKDLYFSVEGIFVYCLFFSL